MIRAWSSNDLVMPGCDTRQMKEGSIVARMANDVWKREGS
ncbi:predicted protein [Sclerotinia sclerotiorum 1980 UF-70]|uniref:Uncharacterized protein n=1 Tax=Sclerotinia sclerotiorum (strain ATCC 18683 / 1980 / Ss-1) TaxID=665079 RepID=A7EKJ7_SCLS1|nr:predicted protein [Sclerotinia sclerotiorum 1980 UF-70]EDO03363.1 predicted protein [Sclerotinia sclerotiorum 1980 UF-70]